MCKDMEFLSKRNVDCLKGIFAIVVLIHHCRAQMNILNNTILGMILTSAGYLSVGMFYFLSGYGLERKILITEGEYIKKFFIKKIIPFYIICIVMIFLYFIFKKMIGIEITNKQFFRSFLFGETIVSNGWYLQSILIVYIIFYFVYKNFKKNNVFLIFIFLIIYSLFSYFFIKKNIYFESVFCFELGILWANYKKRIDQILSFKKNYIVILSGSFLLFSFFLILGNINIFSVTVTLFFKILSSIFFVIFFLILINKIEISNKISMELGKIFLEIYVFQGFVLEILHSNILNITNDIFYLIGTIVLTVIIAKIFNPVFKMIQNKV